VSAGESAVRVSDERKHAILNHGDKIFAEEFRMQRVVIFILVFGLTAGALADDLRLTASEWPPYVSAQLYKNGVAVVLTEEALRRAGHEVATQLAPWPAALESTLAGEADVITSVWRTTDREAGLVFSEPLMTNYIVFVKRYDNEANYSTRADLEGLRIGVVTDYAYSDQPYDTTGLTVVESGSVRVNLQKLLAGQLDLVLADSRVAAYEIDALIAAKELTLIRNPLQTRSLHAAVSKRRPDAEEIVAAINAGISALREDGGYNAILATFRISE
jgi:polar amino acid transport system substrate-binding protein